MASCSLLISVAVFLSCDSGILLPTNSDGITEYYITSTPNQFEHQQIICNMRTCVIHCNHTNSCYNTRVYSTNSDNISLTCFSYNSCNNLFVDISNVTNVNIHCQSLYSCPHSKIHITASNNVLLLANNSNATYKSSFNFDTSHTVILKCNNGACQHGNYYFDDVNHGIIECKQPMDCSASQFHGYTALSMHMLCESPNACASTKLECPSDHTNQCNLTLFGENTDVYVYSNNSQFADRFLKINCQTPDKCGTVYSSCVHPSLSRGISWYNLFPTSLLYYDELIDDWYQCQSRITLNGNDCCPYKPVINCTPNENCVIYCGESQCYKTEINASLALSLTVSCIRNAVQGYACFKANIWCPMSKNTLCDIDCSDDYACSQATIHYNGANNISLNCSHDSSCTEIVIHITNNDTNTNFNLYCTGSLACSDLSVYAGIMASAFINCLSCMDNTFALTHTENVMIHCGYNSCTRTVIEASQSQHVQLICNDLTFYPTDACYDLTFYPPSHANNVVELICDSYSCRNLHIFVADTYEYGYLDLFCAQNSCTNMDVYCIESGAVTNIWMHSCDNVMRCCPFQPPFIQCEDVCELNCGVDTTCSLTIMSGKDGNSMKVNCLSSDGSISCQETLIRCPLYAECIINCDPQQCENTTISAGIGTKLTVNCIGQLACYGVIIEAQYADNINIICDEDINSTDTSKFDHEAACYEMRINADEVMDNVYIQCIGYYNHYGYYGNYFYGCKAMILNADYADKVVIENRGPVANFESIIFANYVSEFTVACRQNSAENVVVCQDLILYGSQHSTLICESYGVCGSLLIYAEIPMDDWNFAWNGCGECDNIKHCWKQNAKWTFYCDENGTMVQGDTFYGDSELECSCCGSNPSKINNGFYDDPKSCIYQPEDDNNNEEDKDSIFEEYYFVIIVFIVLVGILIGSVVIYKMRNKTKHKINIIDMPENDPVNTQPTQPMNTTTEMIMLDQIDNQKHQQKTEESKDDYSDDNPWAEQEGIPNTTKTYQ